MNKLLSRTDDDVTVMNFGLHVWTCRTDTTIRNYIKYTGGCVRLSIYVFAFIYTWGISVYSIDISDENLPSLVFFPIFIFLAGIKYIVQIA